MKKFSVKKMFFGFTVLAVMLIFVGCGAGDGNTSSGTVLNSDFFTGKIEGEITVSAYNSMTYKNYLEEAARGFEALYPGTKVNIETFSAMPEIRTGGQGDMQVMSIQMQDDPQSRQDYLNRVNTNLMSGTGADIYAMDVLPLHKFTQSGTLENLEPYMNLDPNFNKADYKQNIIEALRYKDGIWLLPLDYSFNYFAYDSTLVPANIAAGFGPDKAFSTEQLFQLGIPLYDGTYKLFNAMGGTADGIFNQLLNENIRSFINLDTGRANFVDGKFTGLLSSVKNYTDQGYIPQAITGQQNAGQFMRSAATAITDRYFFKLNANVALFGQFARGIGVMVGMMNAGSSPAVSTDDEIAGIQANADGFVPFTYTQGFGISSQSKNKATAWAFIKYLLSKEMQLSTNLIDMGFRINNEARAERAALSFSGRSGQAPNEQQLQALEKYKAVVEMLSDSINTFVVQDSSLNDMIRPELQYFFAGTRSADEAARVLQNRADLYLSE
ncbi:MAG: extracellular solute-binding protein [Treponema sp.]|jgi:ABC-type glycerol-3-phosphate transport system substrate-binding protein|nr:extracellular solute-binding protein [Treponema sp.]